MLLDLADGLIAGQFIGAVLLAFFKIADVEPNGANIVVTTCLVQLAKIIHRYTSSIYFHLQKLFQSLYLLFTAIVAKILNFMFKSITYLHVELPQKSSFLTLKSVEVAFQDNCVKNLYLLSCKVGYY